MKKISVIIALFLTLCCGIRANAQEATPLIKDLRALMESGKTNFKNDVGSFIKKDETSNTALYKTKKETPAAATMIMQSADKQRVYLIRYDLKNMPMEQFLKMNAIVDQYINELNEMVKSGNYTGKDGVDADGLDVTQVYDLAGNHVLDYKSTKEMQSLYLYGLNYAAGK